MSRSLIDVAYDLAQKEYKDKTFSFTDLFNKVTKQLRLDTKTKDENIGEFYSDLIQDKRFVFCGKNQWRLSQYLTLNEINNLHSNLYNDGSEQVYEEGFEVKQDTTESSNMTGSTFSVEQSDQISEESVQEFMDDEENDDTNEDYSEIERNYSQMSEDDEDPEQDNE